jgi:DNA-binding GntR family transcriptional regulator
VHIEQTVNAIIADIELANVLGVDFGLPLFFAENIYKDKDHNPLAVTHMYYRSDYYTYKANINIAEDKEA